MTMHALARAIAGDSRDRARATQEYMYWNAKGVRLVLGSRASLRATIEPYTLLRGRTQVHDRAVVGAYTYATGSIIDNARVGRFCSIAPNAVLGMNDHPTSHISTSPYAYERSTVDNEMPAASIGHDVWIGSGAVVIAGVHVGDGAVVGAGAVVTADVPPYTVVVGIPARPLTVREVDTWFVSAVSIADVSELASIATRAKLYGRRGDV